jgi:two-component system KDP operon response regulator KdpE
MAEPLGTEPARAMRILHVEDQDLNRRLVKAILERAVDPRLRATILDEAPDLQTARSILAANLPDVILLDVRLPDGNGLDFLRELRSEHSSPRVIVMSASVLASERDEAVRAGCDAFVGKPYKASELTDALTGMLVRVDRPADPPPAGGRGPA